MNPQIGDLLPPFSLWMHLFTPSSKLATYCAVVSSPDRALWRLLGSKRPAANTGKKIAKVFLGQGCQRRPELEATSHARC